MVEGSHCALENSKTTTQEAFADDSSSDVTEAASMTDDSNKRRSSLFHRCARRGFVLAVAIAMLVLPTLLCVGAFSGGCNYGHGGRSLIACIWGRHVDADIGKHLVRERSRVWCVRIDW